MRPLTVKPFFEPGDLIEIQPADEAFYSYPAIYLAQDSAGLRMVRLNYIGRRASLEFIVWGQLTKFEWVTDPSGAAQREQESWLRWEEKQKAKPHGFQPKPSPPGWRFTSPEEFVEWLEVVRGRL